MPSMEALHQAAPYVLFLLGLVVGSFLNVLSFRLPEGEQFIAGRSHCRTCLRTLKWFELVPVFSYLFLRGKCRTCRNAVSLQYPVVELVTGILFASSYVFLSRNFAFDGFKIFLYDSASLLYILVALSAFIVMFCTDLRLFLIPDKVVYPAIVISCAFILANGLAGCRIPFVMCDFASAAWSLAGAAFFLGLVLVSKGAWMGLGDVKLAAFMGLFLGLPKLLVALVLAFFAGSVAGGILIALRKKTLQSEVPFGIFLVPATIISFFAGDALLKALHLSPFRW